jgi:5'-methylthioadenosine phosphorylase
VPQASIAFIGGSGTNSISFPEDLDNAIAQVRQDRLVFETPFGATPPFKLFSLQTDNGQEGHVLTVRMHGWRQGVTRAAASRQVFWVLREAGVKRVVAEGGVGAINHLLRPRDLIVPSDYLDFSLRKDVSLGESHLMSMRRPACPDLRTLITREAESREPRVFERGVYAVTDGRHFESPAEVAMFSRLGADVVGQSMCPEVYLAREIGACYARLDMVVNYAEGVVQDWEHTELKEIFYGDSTRIGRIILKVLRQISTDTDCECAGLRWPTMLT